MKATKSRWALTIMIVTLLLIVAVTRYSGVASALPSAPSSPKQNIFFAGDVACLQSSQTTIPGSLKNGAFTSLNQKVRALRAKIALTAKHGGVGLQALRQEYKSLNLRKAMYAHMCAAGPSQIQALAKVTKMSISSKAFSSNGVIPDAHSCWVNGSEDAGDGQSPQLTWSNIPKKATRLALLVHDRDADFIHWFMIIEKKSSWFAKGLPQDVPDEESQDIKNSFQDENDFGIQGYSGPCPPEGENHRYTFELLALNAGAKGTAFGDDAATIRKKLKKNTIISATLTGFFTGKAEFEPTPSQGKPGIPPSVPIVTPEPVSTPVIVPTTLPPDPVTPPSTPLPANTPTPSPTSSTTPTLTPTVTVTTPPGEMPLAISATQVALGSGHSCALTAQGE